MVSVVSSKVYVMVSILRIQLYLIALATFSVIYVPDLALLLRALMQLMLISLILAMQCRIVVAPHSVVSTALKQKHIVILVILQTRFMVKVNGLARSFRKLICRICGIAWPRRIQSCRAHVSSYPSARRTHISLTSCGLHLSLHT
jgi:hypothetical protein